jgi:probable rRNA maturation factor
MLIFETAINGVNATALQRFAHKAQALAKVRGEIDILVYGNKRLQELNRRFRRKNKPTDVLSFPRTEGGDIAISADIARKNAALYGHAVAEELKILILHGMLHLAGYDHETDNGRMARVEARLRAALRLPASLIDRTHSSGGRAEAAAKPTPPKVRRAAAKVKRSRKATKPIRKPSAARTAQ